MINDEYNIVLNSNTWNTLTVSLNWIIGIA